MAEKYIKLVDGVPIEYTTRMLRYDHPNISFPKVIGSELLSSYGLHPLVEADEPEFDQDTEVSVRSEHPSFVDNKWTYTWTIRKKTDDEIAKDKALKEEKIRRKRETLLSNTDWWAVSDRAMTDEQATYRQALRDITTQEGFPENIIWPVQPTE